MRTQYDDPPRTFWRVHRLQRLSRVQVREAELHWREVPALQRRRSGGEEGAQGEHVLRLRKLSQVQVHFRGKTAGRKVPELRQRISGGENAEGGSGDRVSQQRMRL